MTAADLARFRRAVQLRDRCVRAAIEYSAGTGDPLTDRQARMAYDAMAGLIHNAARADAAAGVEVGDGAPKETCMHQGRPGFREDAEVNAETKAMVQTVYIALDGTLHEGTFVLGVASTAGKARAICEKDHLEDEGEVRLQWCEAGVLADRPAWGNTNYYAVLAAVVDGRMLDPAVFARGGGPVR
jgi:hypothetical protein